MEPARLRNGRNPRSLGIYGDSEQCSPPTGGLIVAELSPRVKPADWRPNQRGVVTPSVNLR